MCAHGGGIRRLERVERLPVSLVVYSVQIYTASYRANLHPHNVYTQTVYPNFLDFKITLRNGIVRHFPKLLFGKFQ